jgi:hypothetical protein
MTTCLDQALHGIQIQTTSRCNGGCIICCYPSSWHAGHPGEMTDELFSLIIEQIKDIHTEKICPYLENEPLMDKKIFERIETIKQRCSYGHIEVSTNALLLTPYRAEGLLDALKDASHEIWISFHGVDKESYEQIMRIPFDQVYQNIIGFLKLCEKNSPKTKVVIRGAGLPKIKQWTRRRLFNKGQYERFWADSLDRHGIAFQPRIEFFRYHDRAGNLSERSLSFRAGPRRDLAGMNCPRVDKWLHFLYNGDMILCCMDYHRETVFGNIAESSIEGILNGNKYKDLQSLAMGEIPAPDNFICRRCFSPGG